MPHKEQPEQVVLTRYLRDLSEQMADHPRVIIPPLPFADAWLTVKALHDAMHRITHHDEAFRGLERVYGIVLRAVQPTQAMKQALQRGLATVERKEQG